MRNKVLLLLMMIILQSSPLFSSDNILSLYTNNSIKDTIPVFGKPENIIQAYFFVDQNSCFTCNETIKNISNFLTKKYNSKIVMFLNASESYDTLQFRIRNNWEYSIVLDFMGAYKKLYNIEQFPIMYLTDNKGVIEYIGIPGSNKYFDIDTISIYAKNIFNSRDDRFSIKGLMLLNKKVIRNQSNKNIKILDPFAAHKNSYSKNIIISSIDNNKLYLIDSNSILINELQLDKFSINRHTLVQGNLKNDDVYIYTISPECSGTIYRIDLINMTCDSILRCNHLQEENTLPYFSVKKLNDSMFLINQMPYSYNKITCQEPTIRMYKTGSGYLSKSIGKLDSTYVKYYLVNYFGTEFCLDIHNNIYEYQNFTDSIFYYDLINNTKESYPISFDSTFYKYDWKSEFDKINNDTDIEIVKTLRYKVSSLKYNNAMIYDNINDDVYIFYGHNVQDSDIQKVFMNKFNRFGIKPSQPDIQIPYDCIIIGIKNKIIKVLRTIDGNSYLVDYILE